MMETIVLASGVFDLLHYGHVRYLEEAKRKGGRDAKLIVIVARDRTVERKKGEKPIVPENQRRALVEALEVVDEALLGYEDLNLKRVIDKIKPSVVAVGYDQRGILDELEDLISRGGYSFKIARIGRFGSDDLASSSKIKRKIVERWGVISHE
ncbi:MAG: adenylyltransferase/cytidyltransferase family protein [Candidatus Bathyarchaeia archaeon]